MSSLKASNLNEVSQKSLKRMSSKNDPPTDIVISVKVGRKPKQQTCINVDDTPVEEKSPHLEEFVKEEIESDITIEENSYIEEKSKTNDSNVLDIQITNIASYADTPIALKRELLAEKEFTPSAYSNAIDLRINISKCVNEFYKARKLPNFNDVYEAVKNIEPATKPSDFEKYMTCCGYSFHSTPSGDLLMEDPKITFERYFYLDKLIKLRQINKQNIYYIDQRIVDVTLTFNKPSLHNFDDSFQSPNNTVLLYLVCSNTGNATGIFTNNVDFDIFRKWITDVVVDVLNPKSVVVMDDIFKQTDTKPAITVLDTKETMLKWLKGNSIPCTNNMRKPELYELYKKSPRKYETFNIKTILEARGHSVLYVPTSLSDLCPTNHLWNNISEKLSSENRISLMCRNTEGVSEIINKITSLTMPVVAIDFLRMDKRVTEQVFDLDAEIERSLDELMKMSK